MDAGLTLVRFGNRIIIQVELSVNSRIAGCWMHDKLDSGKHLYKGAKAV